MLVFLNAYYEGELNDMCLDDTSCNIFFKVLR